MARLFFILVFFFFFFSSPIHFVHFENNSSANHMTKQTTPPPPVKANLLPPPIFHYLILRKGCPKAKGTSHHIISILSKILTEVPIWKQDLSIPIASGHQALMSKTILARLDIHFDTAFKPFLSLPCIRARYSPTFHWGLATTIGQVKMESEASKQFDICITGPCGSGSAAWSYLPEWRYCCCKKSHNFSIDLTEWSIFFSKYFPVQHDMVPLWLEGVFIAQVNISQYS